MKSHCPKGSQTWTLKALSPGRNMIPTHRVNPETPEPMITRVIHSWQLLGAFMHSVVINIDYF